METKRRKPNRKSTPTKLHNGSQAGSVITVELETTAPISDLKKIIGTKMSMTSLHNHEIYLQDILLDPNYSLYDQAVRVSGSVELKVQVETYGGGGGRLTIVEIAKNMTDEEIKALGGQINSPGDCTESPERQPKASSRVNDNQNDEDPFDIPGDPTLWTPAQVHSWMLWIGKGYNLDPAMIRKPGMDGKKLCALPIEDFFIKFPYGNIFWSHLSYLKKLCPNAVNNNDDDDSRDEETALNLVINDCQNKASSSVIQPSVTVQITNSPSSSHFSSMISTERSSSTSASSSRPHNGGGQIQLWQFLLELLTDADECHVITWVGDDGGFKFLDPEKVAQKWGGRKGKPAMNYEKLSRALRYYYDGDMISKVAGKRFEYKFVCNLKEILGYDAAELHKMVRECYEKRKAQRSAPMQISNGVIENGTFFSR